MNQNHSKNWRTDTGELRSDGGLISVTVPAGEHVVTLRYRDDKIVVGGLITLATTGVIAFFAVKRLRRRVRALYRFWRALPSTLT